MLKRIDSKDDVTVSTRMSRGEVSPSHRVRLGTGLGKVDVNIATRANLFRAMREKLSAGVGFGLATLNLDHLTKLRHNADFRAAYDAHELVVADGRPVVWLARMAGKPLDLMPGSDLILPICTLCAEMDMPIALVGSNDDALAGAAKVLVAHAPGLKVVYTHAPAYGFDPFGAKADAVLAELDQSGARICFVALGAPKQEIFAARGRVPAPKVGFVSIGAGLDFLSGHQQRAPSWMRKLAMEWVWRAMQNPRNMGPRYARCLAIFPGLMAQALRAR